MIAEEVQYKGYIYDIFGRHYRPDPYIPYHDALRKMLNALIQGSAAGLTRAAMVNIARGCREFDLKSHMVNVVHDEIILDAVETELSVLAEQMPIWMDNEIYSQVVPVSVDMELRGLLCHRCNRALAGWITPDWLRAAAEYLEHPPASK